LTNSAEHKRTQGIERWSTTARYSLALAVSVLSVVVEFLVDRTTQQPIYPFLPAFGALIASAAWAGAGPCIFSTLLLTAWSVFDLHHAGRNLSNEVIRSGMLLAEGFLLSFGSERMLHLARDAARSEAWHRGLFDTASEGIWVCDPAGTIMWANARIAALLGSSVDDIIGSPCSDYVFPSDRAIERIREEAIRTGKNEPFDRRLRRKNGTEVWVLASSNLFSPETGAHQNSATGPVLSILSMMTDITERKRAEHELRRSEARFRNLFEGVLEGVYQSTPDGRILAANPMLLNMLGLDNADQLGDINISRDFYVDPTVRPRLLEHLEREGGFQNVEYQLRCRDGRIITVLENARVVRDENGAILYYEGTLSDITSRLRMEDQLRRAQRVEALGSLAAGIAHDFDNVLTVITGHAQLAVSELEGTHPARLHTEQVLDAAQRATGLTRQLLEFSRRRPEIEVLDLDSVLADFEQTAQAAGNPPVELRASCDPECRAVYASRGQIDRVLAELLAGARRNFPSVLCLRLTARPVEADAAFCHNIEGAQPGPYTALSVVPDALAPGKSESETGAGDRGFSREMWAPSINVVASQCGGFTYSGVSPEGYLTLSCYLPRAPQSVASGVAPGVPAVRETILLVDDQPLIRELSRDLLERQGYQVSLASDEIEADHITRTSPRFDLLIADAATGPALAKRLRAGNPGLKVLLISGYTEQPESPDLHALNAEFLQKPFSADSLGRKIRQVLNRV